MTHKGLQVQTTGVGTLDNDLREAGHCPLLQTRELRLGKKRHLSMACWEWETCGCQLGACWVGPNTMASFPYGGPLVGPGAAIGLTPQSRNRPMPIFAQAICPFCLSQLWLLSAFFSHSTPVPCAVPAKLSIPGKKHWQAGAQEGPGAEQA